MERYRAPVQYYSFQGIPTIKLLEVCPHRFREVRGVECPQCNRKGNILIDNWPPNYGSGSLTVGVGQSRSVDQQTVKYICCDCQTAFTQHRKQIIEYRNGTLALDMVETHTVSKTPMRQMPDGVWLTPHDVVMEIHFLQKGFYPMEAYC